MNKKLDSQAVIILKYGLGGTLSSIIWMQERDYTIISKSPEFKVEGKIGFGVSTGLWFIRHVTLFKKILKK